MLKKRAAILLLALNVAGTSVPVAASNINFRSAEVLLQNNTNILEDISMPPVLENELYKTYNLPIVKNTIKKIDVRDFLYLCDANSFLKTTVTEEQKAIMKETVDQEIKGLTDTLEKVKAITAWINKNVKYISDSNIEISAQPYEVFTDKKAVCGGFSNLLNEMLSIAGIPSVAVIGSYYGTLQVGQAHQWNAAYTGDRWVYCDSTGNLVDDSKMETTHVIKEVIDAYISYDGLTYGYFDGFAVVAAEGSIASIPNTYKEYPITSISHKLFAGDNKVEELYLNSNILYVEESSLASSKTLKKIEVDSNNPSYASHQGALFTKDKTGMIVYPAGSENKTFTLPKETTGFDEKNGFTSLALENLHVEDGNSQYASYEGCLYNADKTQLLFVPSAKQTVTVYKDAEISSSAFANYKNFNNLTIVAIPGSPAAAYAKENNIAYEEAGTLENADALQFLSMCNEKDLINITVKGDELAEIEAVVNTVIKDKTTDEEKARALTEWVNKNVTYQYGQGTPDAYTVFKQKSAVCGGFSNLLKEMLNIAGIPSVAMVGLYTGNMPVGQAHQWNAAYVNGKWVQCDGTGNLFDTAGMDNTHRTQEVKEAYITFNGLRLGYYNGLAVTGSDDVVVTIPDAYQNYAITALSYELYNAESKVQELHINANIISIEITALKSSSSIKKITVSQDNKVYASHEGALFNADKTNLLVYPRSSDNKEFTLPKETVILDEKEDFNAPKLEKLSVEEGNTKYCSEEGILYDLNKTRVVFVPQAMKRIVIPNDAEVSLAAFPYIYSTEELGSVTIVGKSGSKAESFAKLYNLKFEILGQTVKTEPVSDNFQITLPVSLEYDGITSFEAKVTVKQGITGMGTIKAVKYNGEEKVPTKAGKYEVSIDIEEGENYTAKSDLLIGSFTVSKKEIKPPNISSKEYTGEILKADIVESSEYSVVSNDGGKEPGNYEVILQLTDPDNYQWSGSEDDKFTLVFTITGKKDSDNPSNPGEGGNGSEEGGNGSEEGGSGSEEGGNGSEEGGSGSEEGGSGSEEGGNGSEEGGNGSEEGGSGSDNDESGSEEGGSGSDNDESGSQEGGSGSDNDESGSQEGGSGSDNDESGSGEGGSGSDNDESGSDNDTETDTPDIIIREGIWVTGLKETYDYTGSAVSPAINVYHGNKLLIEKKDYTLVYKNNKNASDKPAGDKKAPYVEVRMKGNYQGKTKIYYTISPIDISETMVVEDKLTAVVKQGKKANAVPVLYWKGKKLKEGKDYIISGETKKLSAGRSFITIEGKNNFKGTITKEIFISEGKDLELGFDIIPMNSFKIIPEQKTLSYEEGKKAVLSGYTLKGKALIPDKEEYEEFYYYNDAAGTGYLVLKGTGADSNGDNKVFCGTVTLSFKIQGTVINGKTISFEGFDGHAYDFGKKICPTIANEGEEAKAYLSHNGQRLEEGKHYTVVYKNNVDKGTATATFTGIASGGYTGTYKKTFKIEPLDINTLEYEVSGNNIRKEGNTYLVPFTKSTTTPTVVIARNGIELTYGKDYTIIYKNNKNIGQKATATVKGKGNYSGSFSFEFKIEGKELSNTNGIRVEVKDKVDNGKAGNWKQAVKVYDSNGKVLGKKDYKIVSYKIVESTSPDTIGKVLGASELAQTGDVIQVTVEGIGSYTSPDGAVATGTYRILTKGCDISKASIKLKSKEYTGDKIEILGNDDFDKAILNPGSKQLIFGKDMEVVEGSYMKNIEKGTARVTLKGIGNFGGTKTITFKITGLETENKIDIIR